jgi:HK97 family phage prohead protease
VTTHVLERRNLTGDVEYRAGEDGKGPVLGGHAAVFKRWSLDLGGFKEQVDPGAFNKTVREADVVALWNHDSRDLLGRVRSGTLTLEVTDRGLAYTVDPLPDTTVGRDVAELARRGDITGSSFGFRTIRDEWHEDDQGNVTRTLLEVALIDVSPVTSPAYVDTDATVRSVAAALGHDFDEVRDAIEARSLGQLIRPAPAEIPPTEPEDERRAEPTFAHRRLSWAY